MTSASFILIALLLELGFECAVDLMAIKVEGGYGIDLVGLLASSNNCIGVSLCCVVDDNVLTRLVGLYRIGSGLFGA